VKFPSFNICVTLSIAAILMTAITVIACSPVVRDYPKSEFIESEDCKDLEHNTLPTTDLTLSADGLDITIQIEIADELTERAQGLMCRESITADTGMLFTYDSDRSNGFWMKNTYVPIDILHIDSAGNVVDLITMSPCPRDGLNDGDWQVKCASDAAAYTPIAPWRYTLELPAGWLAAEGMADPVFMNTNVYWSDVSHEN